MPGLNIAAFVVALALTEGHGVIRFDTNVAENAVGPHQVRPIMIREMQRLRPQEAWTHEAAQTWEGSAHLVATWATIMSHRKPQWSAEDLAHAWNAGPDLWPPAPKYRKRFSQYYQQQNRQ